VHGAPRRSVRSAQHALLGQTRHVAASAPRCYWSRSSGGKGRWKESHRPVKGRRDPVTCSPLLVIDRRVFSGSGGPAPRCPLPSPPTAGRLVAAGRPAERAGPRRGPARTFRAARRQRRRRPAQRARKPYPTGPMTRPRVVLPPLAAPVDRLWHVLLDLAQTLTAPWAPIACPHAAQPPRRRKLVRRRDCAAGSQRPSAALAGVRLLRDCTGLQVRAGRVGRQRPATADEPARR
jgi:hypothetical protein